MAKKYEFTGETRSIGSHTKVHRIRALQTFKTTKGVVRAGELGGWIEDERNLENQFTEGRNRFYSWVADEAYVFGCAQVKHFAVVYDQAQICGDVTVQDWAKVYGRATICAADKGWVYLCDACRIFDSTQICAESAWLKVKGHASIHGQTKLNIRDKILSEVKGNAELYGRNDICGKIRLTENAKVGHIILGKADSLIVSDNAKVIKASISGELVVSDNAVIMGAGTPDLPTSDFFWTENVSFRGLTYVSGDAYITSSSQYLNINANKYGYCMTFFPDKNRNIQASLYDVRNDLCLYSREGGTFMVAENAWKKNNRFRPGALEAAVTDINLLLPFVAHRILE